MQLVAYGAQDAYLSGNPEVTFFKVVYRRHTNFSVEPIQQTWNGAPDFGRTVTCNINRNGDLITNVYVTVLLNAMPASTVGWGYVKRLGHAMIDGIKIEIGGSKIDEQYGDWLNIWYELTHKQGQEKGYDKMIGNIDKLTTINTQGKKAYQLYVPLQFWFNRNNGLALPLIALQYHDVRITLVYRKALECINWVGDSTSYPSMLPSMQDSYLLIDYIYLDSEERKRFAQASHEYLIEQLQFTGSESLTTNPKYRLNFNHPSKYLIWAPHLERYNSRSEWLAYSDSNDWTNARDRFAKILYIASRAFKNDTSLNSNNEVVVKSPLEVTEGGVMFEADTRDGLSELVKSLLDKVDVRLVCQSTGTVEDPNNAIIAEITPGVVGGDLISQLLINSLVARNDLTMEDISRNAAQFSELNSTIINAAKISTVDYYNYGNFIDGTDNPIFNAKLQLNGHDRFQARDGNYFNYVQPFQHFSNTPSDGVNVYSFALKAEEHQPTGTCNFSRIDNATLQLDLGLYNMAPLKDSSYASSYIGSGSLLNIYTMNYNVLRVLSGMAGLAYSN